MDNTPSSSLDEEFKYFDVSTQNLEILMHHQGKIGIENIMQFGGVNHICDLLRTTPEYGISTNPHELKARIKTFGENTIHIKTPRTYMGFIIDVLKDPTLIILEIVGTVSAGAGLYLTFTEAGSEFDWVEGIVILISVFVIVLVTAGTNYKKEQQFRNLKKRLKEEQKISVIRDGRLLNISIEKLLVGDICLVKYGNIIPADSIILQSNDLKVDESTLTGEADLVIKDIDTDIILLGGTRVMQGNAKILITAVGINSQNGVILRLNAIFDDRKRKTSKGQSKTLPSTSKQTNLNETNSDGHTENHAQPAIQELRMSKLYRDKRRIRDSFTDMIANTSEGSILQKKLYKITLKITNLAICTAILTIIILYTSFAIKYYKEDKKWDSSYILILLRYLLVGISILIVGIPEGLPLAVTLALAYSIKKMMSDNNLVRNLASCETMGNATTICSDKTGTLTTNRMTCIEIYTCENIYSTEIKIPKLSDIVITRVQFLIIEGIAVNTSYTSNVERQIDGNILHNGDKTECALLGLVLNFNGNYQSIRNLYPDNEFIHVFSFNSDRKSMSTIIKKSKTRIRLYTKGGSDIVLKNCKYIFNRNGEIEEINDNVIRYLNDFVINRMANTGLRTIILAYRDFLYDNPVNINEIYIDHEPNWNNELEIVQNLTIICITGIEDPLRPDVYEAIKLCQLAGIVVRMITGDNIQTAKSIALKCGIVNNYKDLNDPHIVLDGETFNKLIRDDDGKVNQELLDMVWPKLRVLARSRPMDKYILVKGIIETNISEGGQIVAVTGDGTNDGPALRIADVGFAMGLTGTDVAKQSSDIIITDDNFSNIVKAIMWGRNVYDAITKFLQFQLTVNFVAVVITFIGALYERTAVIRSVQLLWVNLIMDALASLALATEKPTIALLYRKPYGRKDTLISLIMWKNIITQSVYQIIVLTSLLIYTHMKNMNPGEKIALNTPNKQTTIIFNTLVMMTLFNEISSRKVHGEYNCCVNIFENYIFLSIWFVQLIVQILIIQFGSIMFSTTPLTLYEWSFCIFFGLGTLLWAQIWNHIPIEKRIRSFFIKKLQIKPFNDDDNSSLTERNDSKASRLLTHNHLSMLKNMYDTDSAILSN